MPASWWTNRRPKRSSMPIATWAGSTRQLLAWKYHDGCSTDEIGRQLQRSLAWVRTVLFRVRQQLKECIEEKVRKEGWPRTWKPSNAASKECIEEKVRKEGPC